MKGADVFPVLIPLVLVAAIGLAVWLVRRKAVRGGGCCGAHQAPEKKTPVKDRNRSHYPHRVTLKVGGMTCENCARRVENALNGLEGVWARVDIGAGQADVRLKTPPDRETLARAVSAAGYAMTEMKILQ